MEFEWDEDKAVSNLETHKVSFEEAATVFDDPDHSYNEHRYIIIGESRQGRLLMISYTDRGEVIRLISARKATKAERRTYEEE